MCKLWLLLSEYMFLKLLLCGLIIRYSATNARNHLNDLLLNDEKIVDLQWTYMFGEALHVRAQTASAGVCMCAAVSRCLLFI